jgi:hypothetical protein
MSRRESGVLAVAFALGMLLMLASSPASALCNFQCTCTSSCDDICTTGPDVIDCPGCNETTCGNWGVCIDACGGGGSCQAISCSSTINGTSGGDTLSGNGAHECINGFGGADTLTGNAGDDTIQGGDGNDTMYGNSGNDCLYGDAGTDSATGGTGTDFCDAEAETSCEI